MHSVNVVGDINNNDFTTLRNILDSEKQTILLGNYFKSIKSVNQFLYLKSRDHIILKGDLEDRLEKFLSLTKDQDNILEPDVATVVVNLYNSVSIRQLDKSIVEMNRLDLIRNVILNKYTGILEYLRSRPLFHEIDQYIFVHGAINLGLKDWGKTSKETLLRGCQSAIGNKTDRIIVSSITRNYKRKWFKRRMNPIIKLDNIIVLNSQGGTSMVTLDF